MQTEEDKKALAQLVKDGIRIPAQPSVLLKLNAMIASGRHTIKSVARAIAMDPGLVAMLYKTVRLPVFSAQQKMDSLEDVVSCLGVKQTLSLVKAASLSSAVSDEKRRSFEVFWTRADEMAHLAAIIADDQVSVCNVFPEQAYMAGIFHECGVPVLMLRFPQYCETMHLDSVALWPDVSLEDEKFEVDHCTVGYLVARHWGLPDFVCKAILHHNELPDESLGATTTLIAILQLAIHFYHRMNKQPNPVWATIGPRVLDEIGIHPSDEDDYFEEIIRRFLNEGSEVDYLFAEKAVAF